MEKFNMAKKSQIEKIETALATHNTGPGITVAAIAKMAGVSKDTVYKRVADLREDYTIYSNYRNVNGKRKLFYRMAG
jgi:transposase